MALEELLNHAPTIAVHASAGILAGIGAYKFSKMDGPSPSIGKTALAAVAGAALGPHAFAAALVGGATGIVGAVIGDKIINDGSGNETSFIGKYVGFTWGASLGALGYLGWVASQYF